MNFRRVSVLLILLLGSTLNSFAAFSEREQVVTGDHYFGTR